eukprot:3308944-Pleurochrysis_carterae.AAC.6
MEEKVRAKIFEAFGIQQTNRTLDDHVWVATLEENWGVKLWPDALFTQAGEPELSTMTHLALRWRWQSQWSRVLPLEPDYDLYLIR